MTDQVSTAAEFLRRRLAAQARSAQLAAGVARIAIVLGSGLGAFAAQLDQAISISYRDIPYFPVSSVPGHSGKLVSGLFRGVPVLVMQGRFHAYEGYTAAQVTFPVRTLALLGVQTLVLTNAAGGIRLDLRRGQLVLIEDHINFSGLNPAAGPPATIAARNSSGAVSTQGTGATQGPIASASQFGPRFFDMSQAYSPRLREIAHAAAAQQGSTIAEGVYVSVLGPSFETPAEIRAFRAMGADLVGMSTVLETIAARQLGIEVLGISCVTNMAAGVEATPLSHEEVMEVGSAVEQQLANLLGSVVPRIERYLKGRGSVGALAGESPALTLGDRFVDPTMDPSMDPAGDDATDDVFTEDPLEAAPPARSPERAD